MSDDLKERVREFWQANPCASSTSDAAIGSPRFFADVEAERYRLEPYVHDFADFPRWAGKRVLEVGMGLGTDFVQFVRAGADATGIDLTELSVEAVRTRLAQEQLSADVRVADAEALPFEDATFDLVYSYGVLHHTPDTARAVAEVRRVLRPDGEGRVMLYARHSWLALGAWVRWGLARGRPWRTISDVLSRYLESPGTKAYTDAELRELFSTFSSVEIERRVTPYDRRVAGPIAGLTGPRFGWFAGVRARP